ncbi:DUF2730 family protein [Spiribacter halobius]|uniref:DUF2730 domain-containing protein n=1 Tax=Sediminicurvatus halobius TaxID=2182432 RepID=A0A2U2N1I6_9GAMM|nr:DUF2730 family protein [Spiribacter halobius]PWG62844.1 hypothetical protein DEM34_10785 [Spiribacter halobius]UEX77006.1 DUF2730 domain-containing protein [Spiribacter halobius]
MEGVIDYGAMRFWMDALQLAGLGMLGLYTHLVQKSKANTAAIADVDTRASDGIDRVRDRVISVERRVDVAESQLASVPTHHDLGRVYERLNTVSQDMRQMTGEVRSIAHQLSMISEYLLQRSGGDSK